MKTEKKILSFDEGMDKFSKEFNIIFDAHLNYFMDALCYQMRIFSFDIVKFDNVWAKRQGYQTEKDGSLADWIEKKYGKRAKELINDILGVKK